MQSTTARLSVGWRFVCFIAAGLSCSATTFAAETFAEAFQETQVSGNVRAHYNERQYAVKPDATAFALGGVLKADTGSLHGFSLGLGFYTAQDLGLNSDDPLEVDGRMGSGVEILGEAYVNYAAWDSSWTVGRQKVMTPFANPIDVFIIPFTYEGVSIKNHSISDLTIELDYLTKIKSAGSEEFVDVGIWSTDRLGVTPTDTSGTLMLGGVYSKDSVAMHAWWCDFADLFTSLYLQADYAVVTSDGVKPFVSAQVISQNDTGDALLGRVDSLTYGLKGGISVGKGELSLGYTNIEENKDSFNNGAFLAPYNFSTSPLYTNSMLKSMENNDAGEGVKLMFLYEFPSVKVKLSYAHLDFATIPDLDATDIDITYSMEKYVEGLSLRYRVELVNSDSDDFEQSDNRLQIQYIF